MYKQFIKFITALAVVGFTAGQAMAATVSISQPNPIQTNGAPTLDLDVVGTGFTTPVDGGAFTFNFDPAVLQFTGATTPAADPGDPTAFWDTFVVNADNAATGTVDFVFLGRSIGFFSGDFAVANMTFDVLGGVGTSSNINFADTFGGWSNAGNAVPVDYVAGQVTVSSVPVPAAVWLFGSGLLGLVGVARRRSVHAV